MQEASNERLWAICHACGRLNSSAPLAFAPFASSALMRQSISDGDKCRAAGI